MHEEHVRDTISRAISAMDDLLFHELGAHRCGTSWGDGLSSKLTDDDLRSLALNWADRLQENADRLRQAVEEA